VIKNRYQKAPNKNFFMSNFYPDKIQADRQVSVSYMSNSKTKS
jgi:hypothetical protein